MHDYIDFDQVVSGAIAGAITDPYCKKAQKHAEMYYQEIRKANTDIEKIASNTDFSLDQIRLIKNYLFIWEHDLEDGTRRFDPIFHIAESWRRLAYDAKNIQPHDITLLKHELLEIDLVTKGYSQREAHENATKIHNYSLESSKFYQEKGAMISKSINAGAIVKKSVLDIGR